MAQEVRALAQRSADAAREIKTLVTGTKAQVDSGVQMVARTQEAIAAIAEQVTGINGAVAVIAEETAGQARDLEGVSGTIGGIGARFDGAAAEARHASGEGDRLHSVILELGKTIREFRIERREAERRASLHYVPKAQPRQQDEQEHWQAGAGEGGEFPAYLQALSR